jgi:hypothetical protein
MKRPRIEQAAPRRQRYAVNVYDLLKYVQLQEREGGLNSVLMIVRPLLSRERVECEGRAWDGDAVLVREDISEERMAGVLRLLRGRLGIPKAELRVYAGQVGSRTWKRLTCLSPSGETAHEEWSDEAEGNEEAEDA